MLKIMILEDEKAQTDRLLQFLSNYHDEHEEFEYIAEAYSRGIAFLDAYKCDADLIFLDIRIPDLAGVYQVWSDCKACLRTAYAASGFTITPYLISGT